MVDVRKKSVTHRIAIAEAKLNMSEQTVKMIVDNKTPKGDVFAVARVAGIQAAKRTHELIPLCHPLALTAICIEFKTGANYVKICGTVECEGKTGVEMEALTAVTVAGLTVYDMVKAVERGIEMTGVRLVEKLGGRSGHWRADKS